jgi:hypothetical protein
VRIKRHLHPMYQSMGNRGSKEEDGTCSPHQLPSSTHNVIAAATSSAILSPPRPATLKRSRRVNELARDRGRDRSMQMANRSKGQIHCSNVCGLV